MTLERGAEDALSLAEDAALPRNLGSGEKDAPLTSGPVLRVCRLSDDARLPERGSAFAAGYDLFR
jgi:hypothetical protein